MRAGPAGDQAAAPRVVAVAGNPNAGKTTLFNALTGAHQRVGNWPGVTVERKVGATRFRGIDAEIVDLPGIYSLRAFGDDERVARDYLLRERADLVLVVVDASNLERNLYLAVQLIELRLPVLVVLNMVDVARSDGLEIDATTLERVLGAPVVETVGNRRHGVDALRDRVAAILAAGPASLPPRPPLPYTPVLTQAIDRVGAEAASHDTTWPVERTEGLLLGLLTREIDPAQLAGWPGLELANTRLGTLPAEVRHVTRTDVATHVTTARYDWIAGLVRECTRRTLSDEARRSLTERIDRVLTNRFLGIPLYLVALWFVFQMVFTVGNPLAGLIDDGFGWVGNLLRELMARAGTPAWVPSLVADGLLGGVGSVVVFLPNILILFLFIALLEDSGYMARAAFVMDRVMHFFGLHGKSFIPMFMGFGCNIPALMATRSLGHRKDRLLTILAIPFMSCSARLTVFVLVSGVFFPEHQGLVLFLLYSLGVALAMVVSRLLKNVAFKEDVAPLIMELPPYKLPRLEWIVREMGYRARIFLRKAGTLILLGSLLLWLAASVPFGEPYASEHTLIGRVGQALSPVLAPAGLSAWPLVVALLVGTIAKEMVVSTLATLYGVTASGLQAQLATTLTPASAAAFMVLVLLYVPCLSTLAVLKRESASWRWMFLSLGLGVGLGYVLSIVVYQVGSRIG